MSKIRNGFIGFIVGDAMGVPLEFSIREKVIDKQVSKMLGFGSHPVETGSWSDDTSMTLALMDSIIEKHCIDYNDIMDKFKEWVNDAKYTPNNKLFDIGRTCLKAISSYNNGINPLECGGKSVNDNGNGSLMRILPIAYYSLYNELKEEEIIKLVNDISSLTHAHEISRLGCYIYVRYIMFLLCGLDKDTAYDYLKKIDYKTYSKETITIYKRILEEDIRDYDIDDIKSSGYVVDTLEAVFWCFLTTISYRDAIVKAINLGNDTDTIGAIVGSMAGIIYGYDNIPKDWIDTLLRKDYIINLCDKFEEEIYQPKKDTIMGTMVGDIVGSRFEINNCKTKYFDLFSKNKCRFSDDTVMTLGIASALLECNDNFNCLSDIAINNMVEIGRRYSKCGFGPTFLNWITSDKHEPYNSYGNGAAMRVSACGIVGNTIEEVKDLSYKVTAVSHNHKDGIKGAEAVAMIVYLIKKGKDKEYLKKYFEENYYSLDYDLDEINKDYKYKISCEATVPQSFKAFYESDDFEDAIRKAILVGGDSDTIGAIAGSFAGIYYGVPKYIYNNVLEFLTDDLKKIYNKFNEKYNK